MTALTLLTDLENANPLIFCQLSRLEGSRARASLGSSLGFWSCLFAPKSYIFLRPLKSQGSSDTCHQPTRNSGSLALICYQNRHPFNFEWQLDHGSPTLKGALRTREKAKAFWLSFISCAPEVVFSPSALDLSYMEILGLLEQICSFLSTNTSQNIPFLWNALSPLCLWLTSTWLTLTSN